MLEVFWGFVILFGNLQDIFLSYGQSKMQNKKIINTLVYSRSFRTQKKTFKIVIWPFSHLSSAF